MKKILYIIAFAITISFSSCTSEVSFLELADSQGFAFTGSTQSIQQFIGQDGYNKLTGVLGIPINTGSNPPMVEGNFPIWLLEIAADIEDPSNVGTIFTDEFMHINLLNQDSENLTIDYRGFFLDPGPDGTPLGGDNGLVTFSEENNVPPTYISGDSSTGAFTILGKVDFNGRIDGFAISGTRTATGVNNLRYAYVVYENGDPNGNVIAGRTFKDSDGVSDSFVWP